MAVGRGIIHNEYIIVVCFVICTVVAYAFSPKFLGMRLGPTNDILSFFECSLSNQYTNKPGEHSYRIRLNVLQLEVAGQLYQTSL